MAKLLVYKKFYGRHRRLMKWLEILLSSLIAIVLLFLAIFAYYAKDLPRPEVFSERHLSVPTKIYDRSGKVLLYTIFGEVRREPIPLKDVSPNLIKAVIATEDKDFYKHHGIDIRGIVRAVLIDLKLRKPIEGASTISQQLIRSTFLTNKKTIKRKLQEVILTLELEKKYSKDQILEWYLNQIPFGPNIYGVQQASQTYFGKNAKDLNLEESATLAALIKAPSYFYPWGPHKKELLERKNYVLDRMADLNFITKKEAQLAKTKKIDFKKASPEIKAPHFVSYIKDYLFKIYGKNYLENNGLRVYTTLDWNLQQKAEQIVKEGAKINERYHAYNAALVAINPKNGQILAMVGSKDYWAQPFPKGCTPGKNCLFEPKVNVTVYGQGRQPGSAFKPFVYATAFEKGYTPDTIVVDEPTNFGKWGGKYYIPTNYDNRFRGPVTLRQALAQSLNVPSVKVLMYFAGIKDSLKTAKEMGITTLNQPPSYYGPALVLGGGEVKPLDMASAYGVFADDGLRVPCTGILKIEDSQGNIIFQPHFSPRRVLPAKVAEMINSILSDNNARAPMFGRRSVLYFPGRFVAVKTGTTNNFKDAWTVGYTHSISVAVWAGNNNNASMAREPGVVIAGHMWHNFIQVALSKYGD